MGFPLLSPAPLLSATLLLPQSALEACCACGGGVNREGRDSLADWKDTGGDSCTEYTTGYYCTVNGMEGIGWNASWGTLE